MVITLRNWLAAGELSVRPVPAILSEPLTPDVALNPVGAVQVSANSPACVQNLISICLIEVVTLVVNAKSYVTAVWPARESEIVTFLGENVPARTLGMKNWKSGVKKTRKAINTKTRAFLLKNFLTVKPFSYFFSILSSRKESLDELSQILAFSA